MPAYHDLSNGPKAWAQITHVDSDDILVRTRSDASVLTMASVIAGSYSANVLPFIAPFAALGFAQEQGFGQAPARLRIEDVEAMSPPPTAGPWRSRCSASTTTRCRTT